MTPYRQLAILEANSGVIDFKVFNPQPVLYRLGISRDGDKNVWHLSKKLWRLEFSQRMS